MYRIRRLQHCKHHVQALLSKPEFIGFQPSGRSLVLGNHLTTSETFYTMIRNASFCNIRPNVKIHHMRAKPLLLSGRKSPAMQLTHSNFSTKAAPTLVAESDTSPRGRHRHRLHRAKGSLRKVTKHRARAIKPPPVSPGHELNEGRKIEIDNHMTIFLGSSKKVIDVKMSREKEFSLFFPKSEELVHIALKDKDILEQVKRNLDKEEAVDAKIQSIDEFMWTKVDLDLKQLPQYYLQLSKIRLTALVVITEVAGYFMAPGVFSPVTLVLATVGTALASSSANALNQFFEVPYDSQMNRTKNRVLVRGQLSPLHAVGFAVVAGTTGITTLALGVNPLTAALGALNIGLYAFIYTPMKRLNVANTWVGSLVGAVPPVMGWTAATGALDPGALLLAGIMYAWQFPHFNALSWNLRQDYSRAGYRMMSVVNPALCKRVAFRYTLGIMGLCTLAPVIDLTTWTFTVDSLPLNLYFAYLGWRFYRDGDSKSSRKLFRFSLIHIPALLVLMFISKKQYKQRVRPRTLDEEELIEAAKGTVAR